MWKHRPNIIVTIIIYKNVRDLRYIFLTITSLLQDFLVGKWSSNEVAMKIWKDRLIQGRIGSITRKLSQSSFSLVHFRPYPSYTWNYNRDVFLMVLLICFQLVIILVVLVCYWQPIIIFVFVHYHNFSRKQPIKFFKTDWIKIYKKIVT